MLSTNDVVLAIAKAYDGAIPGRTLLQKVGYFVGVKLETELEYDAHYYGPYSPLMAATINEMTLTGELDESVKSVHNVFSGHDGERRNYSYQLTSYGERASEIHRSWHTSEFDEAVKIAKEVKDTGANYLHLSFAAKIHYVFANVKATQMTYDQVVSTAETLGWNMSDSDVEAGAKVLRKLGYLAEPMATK